MRQEGWTICACRQAIVWRRYAEIGKASIVSGSTTNGAFVSFGKTAKHGTLKSPTITEGSEPMGIKREDIDGRKVDVSAVHSGRRLPRVHPGEILRFIQVVFMLHTSYNCIPANWQTRLSDDPGYRCRDRSRAALNISGS
jgi:hypothetical protein